MRIRIILAGLALVLLINSQALSQYSAREDFAYVDGWYLDSIGTATQGWGGAWILDTSNAKTPYMAVVADTGFAYADLYNTSIPYIGSNLVGMVPGNWGSARYKRALSKVWLDVKGQYWISYLFDTKVVPSGNTYYLLKLYLNNSERIAFGKGGGGTTYTCGSGWPGGSGADVSTTEDQGGPVWLVAMINLTGDATKDANARTFMWINPDPTVTPDTNAADVKRNTDLSTGFNTVAIEFGGADTNQLGYDEIRLGTSFADVSSPLVTPGFLAHESFEYPTGASSYLTGLGGAENGWAGPWHLDPGDAGVFDSLFAISDTGIAYGEMSYNYSHTGGLLLGVRPADKYTRMERTLDKTWSRAPGRVYWFSAFMNLTSDTSSNSWAGVKLCLDHTDAAIMFGKGWGQDLYTVGSGYHGTTTDPEVSTTTWDAGPVWLVGKIIADTASSKDTTYMWINPDPTIEPDPSTADAKSLPPGLSSFSYVRVEFGGTIPFEVAYDEIRLGTSFSDVVTEVAKRLNKVPTEFALSQNYPNPFNPATQIEYSIVKKGFVTLKVYNVLGQEVETLFSGVQKPGTYRVTFNAGKLASGVYFYRLNSGDLSIAKKMVLIK